MNPALPSHIYSPLTERLLFEQTLLPCLLAGDCVTAMWVPHGGRTKTMAYLCQNASKFNFGKLGKYKIRYLNKDELTEEAPEAYFQLMLRSLNPRLKNYRQEEAFFLIKEKINLLLRKNYHLILILGKFDELPFSRTFFNNLYSLWQMNKTRVHFIFTVKRNIFQKDLFEKYDQLREAISQNLIYFPLFNKEDRISVCRVLTDKYGFRLTKRQRELIWEVCGGHPGLAKACMRIVNKNSRLKGGKETIDFLAQQWEVKIILEDIWKSLDEEERQIVLLAAKKVPVSQRSLPERLLKLRVIDSDNNQALKLFTSLFETFLKDKIEEKKNLTLDKKSGELLLGNEAIKEKITLQEYHLLSTFLDKPNKIISRDEIANVLWGKNSYDKYSDWSIDQIISQLRKKLEIIGISSKNLQTIRKRGYRWLG